MRVDDAGQQLAAELRQLRGLVGISGRELAHHIGVSQSTISRIESGHLVPTLPVVTAWGERSGASVETREKLRMLAEAAHSGVSRFHAALRERPHLQDDIRELETAAQVVRVFQLSVVPGLLQTAEYARRVFSLFQAPYAVEDLAAAIAARLDRQLALHDDDRRFEFLVTEAALRWRPGPPKVLTAQLSRITSLSALDNVSVGVIPQNAETHAFLSHGFAIYDPDDGDEVSVVSVETVHATITVRAAEDVALYEDRWSSLRRMAVFDEAAEKFLADLAEEVRTTGR